ncbi:MAG: HNH endonuclease [Sphingobacterium sp.]
MADPICRWRNPYINTVMELISVLPKQELSQQAARNIVSERFPDFYRTAYQLACQLGLYHENNERYFPKFIHTPTEQEVYNYLENWIIHYSVPNPYTRGFNNLDPISIHSAICKVLLENRSPINWTNTTNEIFGEDIGNRDILRNSIQTYSPILTISNHLVQIKEGKTYDDLAIYIELDITTERNNKEYFFDLFSLSVSSLENQTSSYTNIDQTIIDRLINTPNITQTQKQQIISARIGQGIFRRNLIIDCGYCPITGIDDTNLLVASHIKPWRAANNQERISHKNGILLTPTYDRLFDKGLISFTSAKELIISNSISEQNRQRLNLVAGTIYDSFPLLGREEFLDFHRREIFIT